MPEHHRMHDSAWNQGEAAGDQQRADIGADHHPLMAGDVAGAGVIERAHHAGEGQGHEKVDGAEAPERPSGITWWMKSEAMAVAVINPR